MRSTWLFVCVCTVFVSMLISQPEIDAQDHEYRVGIASVDITPDKPLRLSGYASRVDPFESIATRLFAKALLIQDRDGHRVLIVTTDLLGLPAELTNAMSSRIRAETSLLRHQILFNSSHTHSGPAIITQSDGESWDEEDRENSLEYARWLQDQLVQIAIDSCKDPQPASISKGQAVARFVMNRREHTERGIILGVNPRGLVDRSVPILRVNDSNDEVIVILFGAACHLTTSGSRSLQLSADYAGYAQMILERQFPSAKAMFLQGCGGDANPFPRGEEPLARLHGTELAESVEEVLRSDMEQVTGSINSAYSIVDLPLADIPDREALEELKASGSWRRWMAEQVEAKIQANQAIPAHYPAPFMACQLGDQLTLIAMPGEVVVGYVPLIEAAVGPRNLWISAYCNDVFGYLPTQHILEGGGYETRGLYRGGIGFFATSVESTVIDAIEQLVNEVRD